jgi:tetratricopeptide (TPR) repeat protein
MFDPTLLLPDAKYPTTTHLTTALIDAQKTAESLREVSEQRSVYAEAMRRLGQLRLILGMFSEATEALQEAELVLGSTPDLHFEIGCALCRAGYFYRGKHRLELAAKRTPASEAMTGLYHLAIGSLYHRMQGQYSEADTHLENALNTLPESQKFNVSRALLSRADVAIAQKRFDDAQAFLQKAEDHLKANNLYWTRPAWFGIAGRLALAKNEASTAITLSRKGLGAIDDRGDLRDLPMLYRVLASALESFSTPESTLIEDARDARHRAVAAARKYASRLEMAQTLYELGQHFKLHYLKVTQRARGSGYLYEAEQIFKELGIEQPK